jgi:hypothetical protein
MCRNSFPKIKENHFELMQIFCKTRLNFNETRMVKTKAVHYSLFPKLYRAINITHVALNNVLQVNSA